MQSTPRSFVLASFALAVLGTFSRPAPSVFAANVTSTWSTATSGNWDVNANWSNVPALGGFPNNGNGGVATYDAAISAAGSPYTVTLNTNITVEDLLLNSANATLSHTSGTLTATGAVNLTTGTYSLMGGTIANSTVNATVPLAFSNATSTLSGVTVNGDLSFPVNFARVLIAGGTTFSTAHQSGLASEIGFAPGQTLSGTIQFEGTGGNIRWVSMGTAGSLSIGATGVMKTVAGMTGDAMVGVGNFYTGAMALTNNGLISSQVSGRTITINPATSFTNAGTLEAVNGGILTISSPNWSNAGTINVNSATLNLGGTLNTSGGIGAWSNTGSTVNVTGTINNTASTLTLNNSTGSWNMAGGTINGGTLTFTDGKTLAFSNATSTLSGVTVNGDLSFPVNFARVLIAGGTTFSTAHVSGLASEIGFAPGETLSGTIQFEGAGGNLRWVSMSTPGSLSIGATGVMKTVAGMTGDAMVGVGNVYTAAMALTNNGLISSQVSGRTITINPASFTNTGMLEAINGGILTVAPSGTWSNTGTINVNSATLNLGGTLNASGGIGAWTNTGGTVNVTGTINNAGQTLTLNNSTGSWNMAGGTINGGTLAFADGKTLNLTNANSTLSGVTVNGDLSFPVNFARVLIAGGATFNTAHLASPASEIGFAPGETLSGTIQLEGPGNGRWISMSTPGSLTIGATGVIKTVTGMTGDVVAVGVGNVYTAAMALTNNGLISSQVAGRTLTINPATSFTNAGTLEATGGGILAVPLGYTQTAGITRLNGGGTISARDPIVSNKLNTITIGGGRLEASGTITANVANSGTIAPGLAAAGTLAITGDLTLGPTSTLQIDVGGVRQGTHYDFLSEAGAAALNLAGALSVTLINGFMPAAGDSLIIASSNQPITGMFSNVMGGRVLASDGVTSLGVSVIGYHVVLAELPGDYNGNGVVDAADYTRWRDGLGGTHTQPHYDIWKANFGATMPLAVAGANAAVPEPTGAWLWGTCLGALLVPSAAKLRRRPMRTTQPGVCLLKQ